MVIKYPWLVILQRLTEDDFLKIMQFERFLRSYCDQAFTVIEFLRLSYFVIGFLRLLNFI